MEIKTLQNASRDVGKLQALLEARERKNETADKVYMKMELTENTELSIVCPIDDMLSEDHFQSELRIKLVCLHLRQMVP